MKFLNVFLLGSWFGLASGMAGVGNEIQTRLYQYVRLFRNVPGIEKVITAIKSHERSGNQSGIIGHFFELEIAHELAVKGHEIKGFSVIPPIKKTCEIDVLTNKLCVECKNIHLIEDRPIDRFCHQFLRQKRVAEQLGLGYAIYFRQTISKVMERWLAENDIKYKIRLPS